MEERGELGWGLEGLRRLAQRRGARSRLVDIGVKQPMHLFDVPGRSSGPTVVLVHGLGGSSVGFWRVMFRLAREVGRVVVPDLPGSPYSPLPDGDGPLGLDGIMAAFEAWAERVVPEPAVYAGFSLGGAVVARFTARHPEKASGLVMVAPAGGRVEPKRMQELIDGFQVQTHREARALSRRFFSRPPRLLPFLMGPSLLQMMSRPSVRRLLEDAIRVTSLEDAELEGLKPPILLLWSKNERLLPYEALQHFRQHLPAAAQIEEVEDFGHSPELDRPARLVERIVRFTREQVVAL